MRQSNKEAFAQRANRSLVPVDFHDFLEKEAQQQEAELSCDFPVLVRDVQTSLKNRR